MTNVDISDLLKVDGRMPYNWREASVTDSTLHIQFPNPAYRVDVDKSKIVGDTWRLHVEVRTGGFELQAIQNIELPIPDSVTRIVYYRVKEVRAKH